MSTTLECRHDGLLWKHVPCPSIHTAVAGGFDYDVDLPISLDFIPGDAKRYNSHISDFGWKFEDLRVIEADALTERGLMKI